jgi:hypothetical protein
MNPRRTIQAMWCDMTVRIQCNPEIHKIFPDVVAYLRNLQELSPRHEVTIHVRGHSPKRAKLEDLRFL